MRVYIGPYPNDWWNTRRFENWWLRWHHGVESHYELEDEDLDKYDRWVEKLCGHWQTVLNATVNKIVRHRKRKIKVRIDPEDTWSMDNTLAHIIVPMLHQLKASKHGSPFVDDKDLPAHLKLSKRERKVFDEGHWNKKLKTTEEEQDAANKKFHAGWEWIIDEMIFAFESELTDWEDQFQSGEHDHVSVPVDAEGNEVPSSDAKYFRWDKGPNDTFKIDWAARDAYAARRQNGFRLFGKYYQSLWD